MHLASVHRYPVKSCRGHEVVSAVVEPWGLAGDRRWMIVDDDGAMYTARKHPRLLLVTPTLRPDGISFTSPDLPPLDVVTPSGPTMRVQIWKSAVNAVPAERSADAWFSTILDSPARLVHLADPTQRPTSARFTRPEDRVSFADGYPLLLTTSASLAALNADIAGAELPMTRFRPNVVVDGAEPWTEDGWRRVRIGPATFRAVKGCARCVMTTVDPQTATKGREPIATLARTRRWDGGTWFGMNLVPDTPGATIRPGDDVEILESAPAPDGPPR